MLSYFVLALFVLGLTITIFTGTSLVLALIFGYVVFFSYGLYLKNSPLLLLKISWFGIKTVKNILFIFILIGAMTASWRASGTIAYIIAQTAGLIFPQTFLLLTFWFCSFISLLTGTAFGTAATIGVICMSMGVALSINPIFLGGAILSGIFVGDRCSPMSTSALLTAELTNTDIFTNVKLMIKTSLVPFFCSSLFYLIMGFMTETAQSEILIFALFHKVFNLSLITLLPAVAIIGLSLLKIDVKKTMLISIICALGICYFQQNIPVQTLLKIIFTGYECPNPLLGKVINGGGIIPMGTVFCIVCISSTYGKLFAQTHLLDQLQTGLAKLAENISVFGSTLVTSVLTNMISCNQTLATILTHQLCENLYKDKYKFAITLENTVVVIAALIPWSIAGSVPLTTVGAPTISLLAAVYLYITPIYCFFRQDYILK